ncbi:flagellin B [Thermoplasma volcanium GSS1]|uniref:Flagellin B1 n=1 Tax=Thermoplasma volcanium (strain ATCC 51530 / DSM 4299 / JCM 9571 / NBRC 15438 / GSS1) TaxID=273116 RepID=FLA1_THEVO|nr:flagellin B1 [Thermoplasma volcanium]P57719.2 RecName: Full=Flagellin B1; AltName: Full=41 kDa flagellin; Flags: Precursor [Thermoplasma volcanium GSS1]BAB59749.1 flagellin B [Thermoplasma volcanium GSS1]
MNKLLRKVRKAFSLKADNKAETGIGTLIVFIAMVLVAAVAATVLVHTAGTLQQKATSTGSQTTQQVSTGIQVNSIYGLDSNKSVPTHGVIEWLAIQISITAGSSPINLANVTISLTYHGVSASLTYVGLENIGNATVTNDVYGFNSAVGGTNNVFNSSYFKTINGASNGSKHFAILVLSDPTNSMTAQYPVISYEDQVDLLVNVSAVFGGITEGQAVSGEVQAPVGSPGVIQFTAPESFVSDVIQLQ